MGDIIQESRAALSRYTRATSSESAAKANIDHLFDGNDLLNVWVYDENNPKYQMIEQADAALADGRRVVWHAQTAKGYRGLNAIANGLGKRNLSVIYDPN